MRGLVLPVLSKVQLPTAKEWLGPLFEALAPGLRTLIVACDQVNPPDSEFFTALADALKTNDHQIESFSLICAEKKEAGAAGLPFGAGQGDFLPDPALERVLSALRDSLRSLTLNQVVMSNFTIDFLVNSKLLGL